MIELVIRSNQPTGLAPIWDLLAATTGEQTTTIDTDHIRIEVELPAPPPPTPGPHCPNCATQLHHLAGQGAWWRCPLCDLSSIDDIHLITQEPTREEGGDDGEDRGGDANAVGDGPGSHDAGRSEPEPPSATPEPEGDIGRGDPTADVTPGEDSQELRTTLLGPAPGTIGDRIVRHLREHPGQALNRHALAELVGASPSTCQATADKLYHRGLLAKPEPGHWTALGAQDLDDEPYEDEELLPVTGEVTPITHAPAEEPTGLARRILDHITSPDTPASHRIADLWTELGIQPDTLRAQLRELERTGHVTVFASGDWVRPCR